MTELSKRTMKEKEAMLVVDDVLVDCSYASLSTTDSNNHEMTELRSPYHVCFH